jgi:hypothetical protein
MRACCVQAAGADAGSTRGTTAAVGVQLRSARSIGL